METILLTQKHFTKIVADAFANDISFIVCLDQSCKKIVNENSLCKSTPTHSSEMLAKYSDVLMKKSTKDFDESELEEQIQNTVTEIAVVNLPFYLFTSKTNPPKT